ncbi:hypothetical protein E8L90_07610 [Brevibacillus antibioticus]|uniref:Uncharacterized protein n=1 Tax=Brevibacillus antibioticus TaxID=2570228 RepID=A0A4U2Y487_9BACL|nr:hypothetical protein [Brevibacillus antibioticus]TKI55320.1 hypothetical protein E8L90_07610 [Brevibacillus antibioticus]
MTKVAKTFGKSILALSMLSLLTTSAPTFAQTINGPSSYAYEKSNQYFSGTQEAISQSFIQEVTQYVKLDEKTKQFYLSTDAIKALGKEKYKMALEIITQTNKQIIPFKHELVASNGVLVDANSKSESNKVSPSAIKHSKYWDYDFTWWGLQIYWSHQFIEDLKKDIGLKAGITVGGAIGTIQYLMEKNGKRPPSWFSTWTSAAAALSLYAFLNQDEGCGVYLDCYAYVPTRWHSAC